MGGAKTSYVLLSSCMVIVMYSESTSLVLLLALGKYLGDCSEGSAGEKDARKEGLCDVFTGGGRGGRYSGGVSYTTSSSHSSLS